VWAGGSVGDVIARLPARHGAAVDAEFAAGALFEALLCRM
jgi:hypothetical protein